MYPGSLLADPVTAVSLGLGLMFGTAGLPHILMRFFTVTDAKEARKSVLYASGFVAYFFNVIFLMGLCAILIVGQNPEFFEGGTGRRQADRRRQHGGHAPGQGGRRQPAARLPGGGGLCHHPGRGLRSGAGRRFGHLARPLRPRHHEGAGHGTKEMRVSRIATICLGFVAVGLGILFEKQNIAFMVGLAFGVAASANFPVLILSMYWKGLTTRGALAGGYGGLVSAVALVVLSKSVWVDVLGNPAALFPYDQPALFAMPVAFLLAYIFSKSDSSVRAKQEIDAFDDQYVRGQTGFGAASASNH
jgi:cation/acetate symporter